MDLLKQKPNDLVLYRRRMGFSQKQVAKLLGHRDTSMVSHYEHGRALPPIAVALGLEIIYRVPVSFLFPGMYDELRRKIRQDEESLCGAGQCQGRSESFPPRRSKRGPLICFRCPFPWRFGGGWSEALRPALRGAFRAERKPPPNSGVKLRLFFFLLS